MAIRASRVTIRFIRTPPRVWGTRRAHYSPIDGGGPAARKVSNCQPDYKKRQPDSQRSESLKLADKRIWKGKTSSSHQINNL
jgi:hypothetical protein